ncbi:MAG: aminotransferase class V-fold PLP-dependent enzyme [Verrucomicrobiales bacterium]|nr:aminotransferase class V-fold PLP-dependent enzyme [Verrucomicrobiales bacterium]
MTLEALLADETLRRREFPVAEEAVFLGHAGVTILPRRVAAAMQDHAEQSCRRMQEYPEAWRAVHQTRAVAAQLIGAHLDEISLLGPTSLGLNLVAHGLSWQPGDEVICHGDDYPANVYPWTDLERHGVVVKRLQPDQPGAITPQLISRHLTQRTRLVALASCHYLSGYRLDHDAIGRMLRERGILFCLDAIQTVGAFPTTVEHVDFLAADSHKWMLGPMSAGIFYVRQSLQEQLRPSLLGSWNVQSPNFIASERIAFESGGRRYEPGALNINGILGMKAGIDLLLEVGIDAVARQLLLLKQHLLGRLRPLGFVSIGPEEGPAASGITTVWRQPGTGPDVEALFPLLQESGIHPSLRHDRAGRPHLRFSPHFYNTVAEMDRVAEVIATQS